MDKDRTWIFDDRTVENIVSFDTVELSLPKHSKDITKLAAHVFFFDSYHHEKRAFFRVGSIIYEWIENNTEEHTPSSQNRASGFSGNTPFELPLQPDNMLVWGFPRIHRNHGDLWRNLEME